MHSTLCLVTMLKHTHCIHLKDTAVLLCIHIFLYFFVISLVGSCYFDRKIHESWHGAWLFWNCAA